MDWYFDYQKNQKFQFFTNTVLQLWAVAKISQKKGKNLYGMWQTFSEACENVANKWMEQ